MPETNRPAGARDVATVRTAKSPLEAELIANILRDAGIPTYVAGSLLSDEFAISQRLLGANSVTVQVPHERLPDAEAALAEAREASHHVEEAAAGHLGTPPTASPAPAPRVGNGRRWVLPLLLAGIAALLFVLWMELQAFRRVTDQRSAQYLDAAGDNGEVTHRWREGGALASRQVDADQNGVPELSEIHARSGRLDHRYVDRDQDGMPEKITSFDARGAIAAIAYDDDQNGVYERVEEQRGANRTLVWLDEDQDRRVDRLEHRDSAGKVVRAWTWNDEQGLEPVR